MQKLNTTINTGFTLSGTRMVPLAQIIQCHLPHSQHEAQLTAQEIWKNHFEKFKSSPSFHDRKHSHTMRRRNESQHSKEHK